jgi:hypothetical protein
VPELVALEIRESVAWLRAHPKDQQPIPQAEELTDRIVAAWRAQKGNYGTQSVI